jgi:hypothetical protein
MSRIESAFNLDTAVEVIDYEIQENIRGWETLWISQPLIAICCNMYRK